MGGYKPIIHLWEKKNPQQHKLFSLGVLLRSCLWAEHIECQPSASVPLCRCVTGMIKSSACSLIVEQRIGIHPWICNYQVYSGAVWILFAWKKEVIMISDLCFLAAIFLLVGKMGPEIAELFLQLQDKKLDLCHHGWHQLDLAFWGSWNLSAIYAVNRSFLVFFLSLFAHSFLFFCLFSICVFPDWRILKNLGTSIADNLDKEELVYATTWRMNMPFFWQENWEIFVVFLV